MGRYMYIFRWLLRVFVVVVAAVVVGREEEGG